MTRETKAGLVVSCSFLCLVGVVLYCKLNGPKPASADMYAEGIEAPPPPTAVDENTHTEDAVLPLGSDNAGSSSEKLASTTTESGSRTQSFGNNDGSAAQAAKTAGDGPPVPDQASNGDYASNSTSKTETSSQDKKNASASSTTIYAIPDPVDEDKGAAAANATKSAGSENRITKTGATLDPIQDVKEVKDTGDKSLQDTSKASWAIPPDESGKEKNPDVTRNDAAKTDAAASAGAFNGDQKNTAETSALGSDKRSSDPKTLAEQEPPPIPKGLHDPYQSLPQETPAATSSPVSTADRSPRDASLRKPTTNSAGVKAGKGTNSGQGITGVTTSPVRSDPSSSSGTVTQASVSSPSAGFVGENSTSPVAMNSGGGRNLTPGVMPSPRTLALPPAGDTAPEPNVRLGPPTGSPAEARMEDRGSKMEKPTTDFVNPQSSTVDPRSSLPPSTQLAQGPAPNISGPGGVPSYQTPGLAAGNITGPARTLAAQVDSYDEQTYLWKAADTFATISMEFYHTDKYSQALLLFNRNHPRATAGVRQDPPSLAAGQPVYIPPLRVLEKSYATAIPDQGSGVRGQESGATPANPTNPDIGTTALPLATKEIPAGTGTPNYTIPDGRGPVPPSPAPAGTPGKTQTKASGPPERSYLVPKNGQTFWEISRQTLGNPNRWSEISRLNPQIDPKYPVAGGMTLRMPADARIDPPTSAPVENR